MFNENKVEEATKTYLCSYEVALKETRNTNLSCMVAQSITSLFIMLGERSAKNQALANVFMSMMSMMAAAQKNKPDQDKKDEGQTPDNIK